MGEKETNLAVNQVKKVLAAGTPKERAEILKRVALDMELQLETETEKV